MDDTDSGNESADVDEYSMASDSDSDRVINVDYLCKEINPDDPRIDSAKVAKHLQLLVTNLHSRATEL